MEQVTVSFSKHFHEIAWKMIWTAGVGSQWTIGLEGGSDSYKGIKIIIIITVIDLSTLKSSLILLVWKAAWMKKETGGSLDKNRIPTYLDS